MALFAASSSDRTLWRRLRALVWGLGVLNCSLLPYHAPGSHFLLGLAMLLLASLYEVLRARRQWQGRAARASLRLENLRSQVVGLRSHASAHFLFNSFNALSALIAEAPTQAEHFVADLARVYRYLLLPPDLAGPGEGLSTLETELIFLKSYACLLRTRYGASLNLRLNVSAAYWQHQLPPFTLQALVENAVKHNVLLPHRPLCLTISTTPQGKLRVRNNRQPKVAPLASTGLGQYGLAGLRIRYQVLGQPAPVIEAHTHSFTVTLPLLPALHDCSTS